MVQVAPNYTIIDLTLRGLKQGRYEASIRTSGDISGGGATTGSIWGELGKLGEVEVGKDGRGALFVEREVGVQDVVGRSMVVERIDGTEKDEVLGVIARSAGVWENDKTVSSCPMLSLLASFTGGESGWYEGAKRYLCWCFATPNGFVTTHHPMFEASPMVLSSKP